MFTKNISSKISGFFTLREVLKNNIIFFESNTWNYVLYSEFCEERNMSWHSDNLELGPTAKNVFIKNGQNVRKCRAHVLVNYEIILVIPDLNCQDFTFRFL